MVAHRREGLLLHYRAYSIKSKDFSKERKVIDEKMTVYDNVKRIADEQGLSIRQLEMIAGLSNGTIGGWKKYNPRITYVRAVAIALHVKIEVLLKGVR